MGVVCVLFIVKIFLNKSPDFCKTPIIKGQASMSDGGRWIIDHAGLCSRVYLDSIPFAQWYEQSRI